MNFEDCEAESEDLPRSLNCGERIVMQKDKFFYMNCEDCFDI